MLRRMCVLSANYDSSDLINSYLRSVHHALLTFHNKPI